MSRKYNIVGIIVANVEPKKEEGREKDTNCACLFVPQLCTIDAPRPKIPIKKIRFPDPAPKQRVPHSAFYVESDADDLSGADCHSRGRGFVVCTVCLLLCNFITVRHYSLSFTPSTPYTSTSHSFIHAL